MGTSSGAVGTPASADVFPLNQLINFLTSPSASPLKQSCEDTLKDAFDQVAVING